MQSLSTALGRIGVTLALVFATLIFSSPPSVRAAPADGSAMVAAATSISGELLTISIALPATERAVFHVVGVDSVRALGQTRAGSVASTRVVGAGYLSRRLAGRSRHALDAPRLPQRTRMHAVGHDRPPAGRLSPAG